MNHKRIGFLETILLAIGGLLLFSCPTITLAAQVTLQWDANSPAPEGYRLYRRSAQQNYNYNLPAWNGAGTTCTITGLTEGTTYYFVVRAFQGSDQSGDSNEVQYVLAAAPTPTPTPSPTLDNDGDGWSDALDAFPEDEDEWIDTDGDGTGNNGDLDDDGDGMTDTWEHQYGLNPLEDDAQEDLDGDGVSNGEEFNRNGDPSQVPGNAAPGRPILDQPSNGATDVALTPTLSTEAFADDDGDGHARTCYQVSTDDEFTSLVFQRTYTQHLTILTLPELVLDPETTYFWRVKFFDEHNGASEWSETFAFETISYAEAGDQNQNGILDSLELDDDIDLDQDGTADVNQAGSLQGVLTGDAFNPRMAVKRISVNAQIGSVQPVDVTLLPQAANQPENLTGVIGFKVYLLDEITTATVRVYFSQPAPNNASWYKYDPDEGWSVYAQAVFSANRRSVTLVLEDGGAGDQDGVVNGIILDPAGLGYSTQAVDSDSSSASGGGGGSGCFIETANAGSDFSTILSLIGLMLGACLLMERVRQ